MSETEQPGTDGPQRINCPYCGQDGSVDRLRAELKIAELKNKNSLANNLCPDHRDKQAGKPCLACEIERLRAENKGLRDRINQILGGSIGVP